MQKLKPYLPSLDSRSLSVFRICIALVILADLSLRLGRFTEHYTDSGISPTSLLFEPAQEGFWDWSLFFLSPCTGWTVFLFSLLIASTTSLLIGYQSRLSSIVTWILMVSLHAKSPLICYGADRLLAVLLFWAMWLPLGRHWSVDSKLSLAGGCVIRSGASFAYTLQVALVYWMNAITKCDPTWRRDFTAIEQTLKIDSFSTHFGGALLQFPALLKIGTCFTLYLEELGPFLLFIPFFKGQLRTLAVGLFFFFHLGLLATTMNLGIFPYVGATAWIPFLPTSFWNAIIGKDFKIADASDIEIGASSTTSTACLILSLYVLLWNVRSLLPNDNPWFFPKSINWIGKVTRLKQKWSLFAPRPNTSDGWLIAAATLQDGRQIDLINEGKPLDFTRPQDLDSRSRGCRERGYELYLLRQPHPKHVDFFVRSLKNRWQNSSPDEIKDISLYLMEEDNVQHPDDIKCYRLWPHDSVGADEGPIFKQIPLDALPR